MAVPGLHSTQSGGKTSPVPPSVKDLFWTDGVGCRTQKLWFCSNISDIISSCAEKAAIGEADLKDPNTASAPFLAQSFSQRSLICTNVLDLSLFGSWVFLFVFFSSQDQLGLG